MSDYSDFRMARGVAYVVGGVCCLGAWAWTGNPTFFAGKALALFSGVWDVWTSVTTSREDDERERTASARIEAATAGLEAASRREPAEMSSDGS
jgi:hypothetical protein